MWPKIITSTMPKRTNELEKNDLKHHKIMNCCQGPKLGKEFFDVDCKTLANSLLGKLLVRQVQGNRLSGLIVETECYLGGEDKASHSYQNRRTPGNEPMYMNPGTTYVYMTYGMYFCMNISSKGDGAAVLIRALQPVEGVQEMKDLRQSKSKAKIKKTLKEEQLCNGPSKLCMSLSIDKETCNKIDLCSSDKFWIEDVNIITNFKTVETSRIGIQSAGEEWASKPLRFYIYLNPHLSNRDKKAESKFEEPP